MKSSFVSPALRVSLGMALCALVVGVGCSADSGSGSPSRPRPKQAAGSGFDNGTAANGAKASGGSWGTDNPTGRPGGGTSAPIVTGMEAKGCRNLQCQQHACASGMTTISGRVYDPAGKNPIFNVAVYVPNDKVEPLKLGASCDKCDKLYTGKAVVSTLTDADGQFVLKNAPDGTNIPLVIQIGKWRKQVTIPSVAMCQDTRVPDKQLTLPKNHMEGDIPSIAISTGAADTLECLLRRVGVDASEYTPGPDGEGRIHIFQGSPGRGGGRVGGGMMRDAPNTSPAGPLSTAKLWDSVADLMKFDVVLLSCEGQETPGMNQQALHDYTTAGGRVFASHFHYSWFNTEPFLSENLAQWTSGSNDMGTIGSNIVTTFPKGQALQTWLMGRGALVNGKLQIEQARHNADVGQQHSVSQAWIVADQNADPPGATEYFSFNTPTSASKAADGMVCGRVVFSDLHVGAASNDDSSVPVPGGCSGVNLTPQEAALEFMLFDLSSCVTPDDTPPVPPPVLN